MATAAPRRKQTKAVPAFLNIQQAAEFLNQTERWVRRQRAEKRIPYHKFGRHVMFARTDLEAYVRQTRQEARW